MGICKRKKKKGFSYEVNFTYKENGISKRYFKGGFASKAEAERHEIVMKNQLIETGTIKKECHKTFKQVYDEFLEIGSLKYQANTIQTTKIHVNQAQDLFKYPIKNIDYALLQNFFNKRSDKGIVNNKNMKACLNRVFEYAITAGYITINPLKRVTVTGVENHKDNNQILEENDFYRLTAELDRRGYHAYSLAVYIGYFCGLRKSEIFALHTSDIDLDNGILYVNRKIVYSGLKKSELYTTPQLKSKSSRAGVPIPLACMQKIRLGVSENSSNILVCDKNGKYLHPNYVQIRIHKIAKSLGIDFHFHILRHTYATKLFMDKVDPKDAQELLRHSSYNTTMSVYTHVKEEHKKDIVNRVFSENRGDFVGQTENNDLLN